MDNNDQTPQLIPIFSIGQLVRHRVAKTEGVVLTANQYANQDFILYTISVDMDQFRTCREVELEAVGY